MVALISKKHLTTHYYDLIISTLGDIIGDNVDIQFFLKEELEEERRLFYVAVTRAKQRLFISYLKKRYDKTLQPSRFIGELNNLL